MVFVERYLQILACRLNIYCLQLSGLVIRAQIIIQGKMTNLLKINIQIPTLDQSWSIHGFASWRRIVRQLNQFGYLQLMEQKLQSLDFNEARKLNDQMLGIHAEPLWLPAWMVGFKCCIWIAALSQLWDLLNQI